MKMQKAVFICVASILSMLSPISSFANDVKSDYDRAADFGRYKKYCWQKVETQNPLWIERIKTALNSALAAKGWSLTESGSACDISIVAIEIKRNHDTVNTFYDNFGGGWGWRGFGAGGFGEATTTTDTYQTGTLIVDLFDTKTKNLVWRGSATDRPGRSRWCSTATGAPPTRSPTACADPGPEPRTWCRRRSCRCGAAAPGTTAPGAACARGSSARCTIGRSTRYDQGRCSLAAVGRDADARLGRGRLRVFRVPGPRAA